MITPTNKVLYRNKWTNWRQNKNTNVDRYQNNEQLGKVKKKTTHIFGLNMIFLYYLSAPNMETN